MDIPAFKELNKYNHDSHPTKYSYRVGVLSDTSSQYLVKALKGYGLKEAIDLNIYEAGYDQISLEILNPNSSFHQSDLDYAILLQAPEKLQAKFQKLSTLDRIDFASTQAAYLKNLVEHVPSGTKIILNTFPKLVDNIFGNFGAKVKSSFSYQLSLLNLEIKKLAFDYGNVFIIDVEWLQNITGVENRIDTKFYVRAKIAYSLKFLPLLVKHYLDIIKASEGINLKKCLILDLDNTLWGGVIGDDGMEGIQLGELGTGSAFDAVQRWAKALKNRGIILCVCSKNTESIAKEPFEKHPNMLLRLEDISVFVANWENKADNIRHIKEVLNIGYDSMVFIDDNPFERNLVRQELPQVTVPELPKSPVQYMPFLNDLNLFETASFSKEDSDRTKRYQEEAKRVAIKQNYKDINAYLESMDMKAIMEPFDSFSVPRVAQLIQRSNQFNLRTKRYSEEAIKEKMADDKFLTFQIKLADKFGDYGLISLVIGEIKDKNSLFIDTWIMSCRVLKRGVEKFVLNELVTQCRYKGLTAITGEWLETKKNIIVKDHYKNLGFIENDNLWHLDLNKFEPLKCNIKQIGKEITT